MKIAILSMWLNEEFLARHFLAHYNWVDEINIFIDTATNDSTEQILADDPRTKIQRISFPSGFDNQLRADVFNEFARQSDADWLIIVDSDELIFHPCYDNPRKSLEKLDCDLIFSRMWQIYKHASEKPLTVAYPPLFQRKHGDPNRCRGTNRLYIKPCVLRPRRGIELSAGHHYFRAPVGTRIARWQLYGSHWAFADLDQAIHRQIENGKKRLGKADMEAGLANHLWNIDESKIRTRASRFETAPRLLRNRWQMYLADSCNTFIRKMLYESDQTWKVEEPEKWNDGSQFDIIDFWADRRIHASNARKAAFSWLSGALPR